MADETNPRSLDFQLSHLADLYQKLPRHLPIDLKAMRRCAGIAAQLRFAKAQVPVAGCTWRTVPTVCRGLEKFLRELEGLLPSWSNNLCSRYFSHARTLPITHTVHDCE